MESMWEPSELLNTVQSLEEKICDQNTAVANL